MFGDLRPEPTPPGSAANLGAGTVKDLRVSADSETVKVTDMTTRDTAKIDSIEDAKTARWLSQTLEPARARAKAAPAEDAIDRIRDRVFGDAAARKAQRSIAA